MHFITLITRTQEEHLYYLARSKIFGYFLVKK